jgi:flavin prenyltransferase
MASSPTIILGVSGASGAIYAQRLIDLLDKAKCSVHVIVSEMARKILAEELGIFDLNAESLLQRPSDSLAFHDNADLFSPLASGSTPADAMVICPCSSHCVSAIATGRADTLLLRAAYVALKQRRPLILVHREMPLTAIDLRNMLTLTHAGAIICPAAPGFYHNPQSIVELADFVVGRVLDLLKIPHDLNIRWDS